ncbi:hypothetical protein D3C80_588800 [compost metagenome]
MDKAFIQHAEHDIHRHHGGDNQPDGVAERGLERQRAALELSLNIRREVQRFFCVQNRLNRFAERIVIRDVERNGGRRELIQMVNRQRRKPLFNRRNSAQRHNAAVFAGEAHRIQRRKPWRLLGVVLQHHAILVGLGVNRGDQPLTKGVIQRVIDIRHADTQTAGRVAVDVHVCRQPFILPVAAHV